MACETVKEAVRELWYWQYGTNPTNFTSHLFNLMQKAERGNLRRLAESFPLEWAALSRWQESPNHKEFFAEYGIEITEQPKAATR